MSSDLDISAIGEGTLGALLGCLDMELVCSTPHLLSDVSAWVQHIPFAFALVQLLRPRTIVELGTHKGDSYCGMCQAVDVLALETRCTAVDTWRGDPQCGAYDETILAALRAHHDPRYGRFSTLMPSTFDEAVGEFADGSIDLLHLDGMHGYAAVRHDFFRWLPKLSQRAVVLLHDTHVRAGGFEVFRLWEELRHRYPAFAFEHGCGLGIVAIGRDLSEEMRAFFAACDSSPAALRALFSALGQRLELRRGMALLAEDIAVKEAAANEWRDGVGLPRRTTLPAGNGATSASQDLKRTFDALHETARNQQDDLNTAVTNNRHLLNAYAAMRERMEQVVPSLVPRGGDVAADVATIMRAMDWLANERKHSAAERAELRELLAQLQEEQRLNQSNDISALLGRAIAARLGLMGRRAGGVGRMLLRMLAGRPGRSKMIGISRRVPPL